MAGAFRGYEWDMLDGTEKAKVKKELANHLCRMRELADQLMLSS